MNKETIKKLTKNFPKDVVKQAPKESLDRMYHTTYTHND